jgi:hypothetical protein
MREPFLTPLRAAAIDFSATATVSIDAGCTCGALGRLKVERVRQHCDQVSTSLVGRQLIDFERIGIRATR